MKAVWFTMDLCDCDCINCEYSIHNTEAYPECPYCECDNSYSYMDIKEGKNKVQCTECEKKFILHLSIDHI